MGFQRFTSRFCTFEAPADWRIVAGLGAIDGRDETRQRSAAVIESWVDAPQDAPTYLDSQLEVLTKVESEIELVEKRSLDSGNLSEALLATFRTPLPDGRALLQKQLVAVEGRLICTLTVSGLEDDQTLWNEYCNPILGSFDVPARDWSGQIRESDNVLTVETEHPPSEMHDLPGLGLAIPAPAGWEVSPDGTLRHEGGAEISIRRSGLPAGTAEECFAEALERYSSTTGAKPSAWQRGETTDGGSFWAVDAISTREKTWGPPDRHLHREVYVDDEGVLAFTLDCPEESVGPIEDLGRVLEGYRWLEPERQRLRLGEPWLRAELKGKWTAAGPGMYIGADPPGTMVLVQQIGKDANLADLIDAQIDATRRAPEVVLVDTEARDEGILQEYDAVRYSLDFKDAEGQSVSLRTCWLDTPESRYVVNVRAAASETAEATLRTLLDGFSPEAAGETDHEGGGR
jgi:hypothetical protein